MKTKLLKKIRKRFSYYFNSDGDPVLVDHKNKRIVIITLYKARTEAGLTDDKKFTETVLVAHNEWLWRTLKGNMLKPFGYKYEDIMYRKACRVSKQKIRRC